MYLDKATTGVMIALLPTVAEWSKVERPHLTLVYAGTVGKLDPTTYNELGKDALSLSLSFQPLTLEVLGVETLGDDEKVDTLTLKPTKALLAMRSLVEIWNASEYPFKPHITIGPVSSGYSNLPDKVTFDRVYVSWGSAGITYRFRG